MVDDSARLALAPLNEDDAAIYIGRSAAWLRKARRTGTGPCYIALGRRTVHDKKGRDYERAGTVRYLLADLDAYLLAHRVEPRR